MMWTTEFVHTGVLKTDSEAKIIYKNNLSVGMISTVILLPFVGKCADYFSAKTIIPLAVLFSAVMLSFIFCKNV